MSQHDTLTQALEQIAMAAEATVCNPAWIAKHARAALATPAQAQPRPSRPHTHGQYLAPRRCFLAPPLNTTHGRRPNTAAAREAQP